MTRPNAQLSLTGPGFPAQAVSDQHQPFFLAVTAVGTAKAGLGSTKVRPTGFSSSSKQKRMVILQLKVAHRLMAKI